jgi:hypothetical protein
MICKCPGCKDRAGYALRMGQDGNLHLEETPHGDFCQKHARETHSITRLRLRIPLNYGHADRSS